MVHGGKKGALAINEWLMMGRSTCGNEWLIMGRSQKRALAINEWFMVGKILCRDEDYTQHYTVGKARVSLLLSRIFPCYFINIF
jgi:hypothetical protein